MSEIRRGKVNLVTFRCSLIRDSTNSLNETVVEVCECGHVYVGISTFYMNSEYISYVHSAKPSLHGLQE